MKRILLIPTAAIIAAYCFAVVNAHASASWSAGDPQSHPVPFEVLGAQSPHAVWLRCDRGRCVRAAGFVFGVPGTHSGFCGRDGVRFGSCYQVSPGDVGFRLRVRVGSTVSAATGVVR